ncbi:MAG TPA: HNH nuclease family protein [Verrucomicrobia bacterium]|nr:MAG: hypothetical protein A2X46_02955 [Lentisphaerae bacterium GWF2_57_35]HBA86391.1 HNH nuclease family protein [Verrucomicrobiota bacterium]
MTSKKKSLSPEEQARVLGELRRDVETRQKSYRERALQMFPHLCASCGREFDGKRLRELTVHHKDHNHDNNPPDGSNWELLCMYCHDHEHEKYLMAGHSGGSGGEIQLAPSIFSPFAALDSLLKPAPDEAKIEETARTTNEGTASPPDPSKP